MIEALWRQRWTSVDGLGALIISPTRELVSRSVYYLFTYFCGDKGFDDSCQETISSSAVTNNWFAERYPKILI